MKSYAMIAVLASGFGGIPLLNGCDRQVSHTEESHTNPDGTVTKSQETVKHDANGNVVHEKDVSTH